MCFTHSFTSVYIEHIAVNSFPSIPDCISLYQKTQPICHVIDNFGRTYTQVYTFRFNSTVELNMSTYYVSPTYEASKRVILNMVMEISNYFVPAKLGNTVTFHVRFNMPLTSRDLLQSKTKSRKQIVTPVPKGICIDYKGVIILTDTTSFAFSDSI